MRGTGVPGAWDGGLLFPGMANGGLSWCSAEVVELFDDERARGGAFMASLGGGAEPRGQRWWWWETTGSEASSAW